MLTETGRVVGIEADGLWVQTMPRSTCGACAAQPGCGHGLLHRNAEGRRGRIRVVSGDGVVEQYSVDDHVLIGVAAEMILRGSFIAYVVPLLAMVAGALAAAYWLPRHEDYLAVLGAAGGLALGFVLVYWHSVRHRGDSGFQPVLLGFASPPAEPVTLL
jgi:sigma-E factor negative regulatory protein RseC